jgi:hypothetical protein
LLVTDDHRRLAAIDSLEVAREGGDRLHRLGEQDHLLTGHVVEHAGPDQLPLGITDFVQKLNPVPENGRKQPEVQLRALR